MASADGEEISTTCSSRVRFISAAALPDLAGVSWRSAAGRGIVGAPLSFSSRIGGRRPA